MEGCSLFLLLLVGGGVGFVLLKRRLDLAERRQAELDLELGRLRRLVEDGLGEAHGVAPDSSGTAVAEARPAEGVAVSEVVEEMAEAPAVAEAIPAPETPSEPASAPPPEPVEPIRPEAEAQTEPEAEAPLPPAPEPPPAAPPKQKIQIDWERWIGVRGAAVLGGAVLALAAILFLKFSIERGLIPPAVRVALGILAGLAAVGGAEVLRKRAYGATANALSGSGIVILYASIWAAQRLYDLIPISLAFALMVLVTAVCGLLSWRHRSLVIATLGLLGGFATPFMLATAEANPVGLFGYILVLDVGLLALSRKRGWPLLAHLSLFGTLFYQALWIFDQMASDRLLLTLSILAVFAVLFAVAGGVKRPVDDDRRQRRFNAIAGVSLPFAFSLYLATRADLGEHILPVALLLLLLSATACWMARVHKVPFLAPGAAAASVAVVAVWAARTVFTDVLVWEIVGVTSALAALFWFFGRAAAAGGDKPSQLVQSGSQVAAIGFLLVLLVSSLGAAVAHLWPWAVGWLVLSFLLTLESRGAEADDQRLLAPLVALAEVGTIGVWLTLREAGAPLAWEVTGVAVVLAVFYHLFAEELPADEPRLFVVDAPRSAAFVSAAGLFFVLALAPLGSPAGGFWPWLAGWVALGALLVSRGLAVARGYRQIVAAALFGLAFLLYYLARDGFDLPPRPTVFFALAIAGALVFHVLAVMRRQSPVRQTAEAAAAACPGLLLVGLMLDPHNAYIPAGFFLALSLFLAVLIALSATRYPSGVLYLGTVAVLALVHTLWTIDAREILRDSGVASTALGIQAAAVLLFTFWPFIAGPRLAGNRWALYGSALAGPLWFLSLEHLFEIRFGDAAIGALPLLLGASTLLAALAARRLWASTDPRHRRSLVWFLAVTFAFISVAIPLQLEKEWITVGWALEGLALIALWKRLDHAGLKYLALALFAAVTLRLVFNPAVFGYYPRSGRPIFNWLMYTYLVPAAALLLSARVLSKLEVDRLLNWEAPIYRLLKRHALAAIGCGLAAILIGFWWINLTVIDYFSVGRSLDLSFDRLPARDLSLSLSWAVYALILLAFGMARRSVGLRWLSLGFLILTIGKVFLYDLGQLRDLYRVASLVGLAVSLLLVSLAYQRFVFGRDRGKEEP